MKINKQIKKKSIEIKKIVYKKLKDLRNGKKIYKQELLLRSALIEKGFNIKFLKIKCNHDLGLNYVNGVCLGIKYPESFFRKASLIIPDKKSIDFYFNGDISASGERSSLLEPFQKLGTTQIISSNYGRQQKNKNKFNDEYYIGLANSRFGLCPHQVDWPGNKENLWTYRFIECCFVGTIPVVFRRTPLGQSFIEGFHYVWDDQIIQSKDDFISSNFHQMTLQNRALASHKFCLTEAECLLIKNTF